MARITSFREFWPFYVREHSSLLNRRLHFVGTSIVIAIAAFAVARGPLWLLALCPVAGYGFAWVGHFVVEKNRPATFKYPLYSLASDFVMWGKTLTGRMSDDVRAYAAPASGAQS